MDILTLSRLQFAVTTVYHFFFVPLTLGLSVLLAVMETLYVRTGRQMYKDMVKFWGRLFLINFAMGVVTGIVQEFQFGMNWSEYSRFVGDIFGAPLAIEALLAFFLESTFLGVWIFGWDKVSKRVHLAAIWLVAIGANVSALWILIANSFMQQPVGYVLRNGRAEMNDFIALLMNPNLQVQFPHVLFSGLTTAAFLVIGISAYHLFRNSNAEIFRRSFQIAAIVGFAASGLLLLNGHAQAQHMAQVQPMKLAAAEGLYQTENPASFSLITIGDLEGKRELFRIRVPNVLSLLVYNDLTGPVKGINDLQQELAARYGEQDYVPWPPIMYWSFRAMVGAGFLLIGVGAYALLLIFTRFLDRTRPLLRFLPLVIALPYIANTSGWLMTEIGRSPWIVQGLMLMDNGYSLNLGPLDILLTLVAYTLVYGALMVADVYLIYRFAREGAGKGDPQAGSVLAPSPAAY